MIYDIAIVGGGPAGCSAAVTAANRNLKTILFDPGDFALALRKTQKIKNYLGLPDMSGNDLMNIFVKQMKEAGTKVVTEKVLNVMALNDHFYLGTPGSMYEAKTVILAIGVPHSRGLDGEKDLLGKGISYCATCDGNFYKGKTVGAICTVPSMWPEVVFLAKLAAQGTAWISFDVPGDAPQNMTVEKSLPTAVRKEGNQVIVTAGDKETAVDGLFVLRETDPVSRLLPDLAMDGNYIHIDAAQQTSVPGVFAAGDCAGQPWQINKAAGEGQKAVFGVVDYLRKAKNE
ncbi:MAG: FAD-dependent oxidoreductase [Acidaminococcus sp.]|jgi:thioredoxin reductase (NADPH)|nr:FAD-dependent oxidoreductase [Acidaminococcus sp.]MCI2116765.1 FAD-dependent oxidoreductase [Acidaminococcus sp.]